MYKTDVDICNYMQLLSTQELITQDYSNNTMLHKITITTQRTI